MAERLQPQVHYELEAAHRRIRLTDAGRSLIESEDDPEADESTRKVVESVERALAALHLYSRDQHYVVIEGKVQIVDEGTGRAMPDRAWEGGLHQMVEAKEGLELTGGRETLARITYQRLFRRYLRLCGMSGTAAEVVRVPLHRPSRRRMGPTRCFRDQASKWAAVVDAVEHIAKIERRPVLVGTRTVKASEELGALLAARDIDHVVLNAKQDRDEALTVERAGEPGRVTVATNMAGRGTDIILAGEVAAQGGLHVILTEFHESRRIDRQLFGRSARQGDPGSAEAIVALDDDLFSTQTPTLARWLLRGTAHKHPAPAFAVALLRRAAQTAAESRNRDARTATLQQDRRFARVLAFAGRGE